MSRPLRWLALALTILSCCVADTLSIEGATKARNMPCEMCQACFTDVLVYLTRAAEAEDDSITEDAFVFGMQAVFENFVKKHTSSKNKEEANAIKTFVSIIEGNDKQEKEADVPSALLAQVSSDDLLECGNPLFICQLFPHELCPLEPTQKETFMAEARMYYMYNQHFKAALSEDTIKSVGQARAASKEASVSCEFEQRHVKDPCSYLQCMRISGIISSAAFDDAVGKEFNRQRMMDFLEEHFQKKPWESHPGVGMLEDEGVPTNTFDRSALDASKPGQKRVEVHMVAAEQTKKKGAPASPSRKNKDQQGVEVYLDDQKLDEEPKITHEKSQGQGQRQDQGQEQVQEEGAAAKSHESGRTKVAAAPASAAS